MRRAGNFFLNVSWGITTKSLEDISEGIVLVGHSGYVKILSNVR